MKKPAAIHVLDIPLYNQSLKTAVGQIIDGCQGVRSNHCISATGAHGIIHSRKHPEFRRLLQSFYMNLPDGMPGVWVGRLKGARQMRRCYGPDLFSRLMSESAGTSIRHFLCGGRDGVADRLKESCRQRFGNDQICGTYTPPFLPLEEYDYQEIARQINRSGADIVWIGISTPKQEAFAARLARETDVHFLITVGAAFDFHTGGLRQAPSWMQKAGLEWFFRLCTEPKRLWRRYAEIVPLFILYSAADLVRHRFGRARYRKNNNRL